MSTIEQSAAEITHGELLRHLQQARYGSTIRQSGNGIRNVGGVQSILKQVSGKDTYILKMLSSRIGELYERIEDLIRRHTNNDRHALRTKKEREKLCKAVSREVNRVCELKPASHFFTSAVHRERRRIAQLLNAIHLSESETGVLQQEQTPSEEKDNVEQKKEEMLHSPFPENGENHQLEEEAELSVGVMVHDNGKSERDEDGKENNGQLASWENPKIRSQMVRTFLFHLAGKTLNETFLKKLRVPIAGDQHALLTEQEEITDANFKMIAGFYRCLKNAIERAEASAQQTSKLARIKIKFIEALDQGMSNERKKGEDAHFANINKSDTNVIMWMDGCVNQIKSSLQDLESAYIEEEVSTNPDRIQELNFRKDLLPNTYEFLTLRQEGELFWNLTDREQKFIESNYAKRSNVAEVSPIGESQFLQYITDELNENFHGGLKGKMKGSDVEVGVVLSAQVENFIANLREKDREARLPKALEGAQELAQDTFSLHAFDVLVKHIRTYARTKGLSCTLQNGKTIICIQDLATAIQWIASIPKIVSKVLSDCLGDVQSLKPREQQGVLRHACVTRATDIMNDIVQQLQELASSHTLPFAEHLLTQADTKIDTSQLAIAIDNPFDIDGYESLDFKVEAGRELLPDSNDDSSCPLFPQESAQLESILRKPHNLINWKKRTLEQVLEEISDKGNVLATLAGNFNKAYYGDREFRTKDGQLKTAAHEILRELLGIKERNVVKEEAIIEEELGTLIRAKKWPTEREVQLAMRRIALECYQSPDPLTGSKDPLSVKERRESILAKFQDVRPNNSFASSAPLLPEGQSIPNEYRSDLRNHLIAEHAEVIDVLEQLLSEKKPMTRKDCEAIEKNVHEHAYDGRNIWKYTDFEEFVHRMYPRVVLIPLAKGAHRPRAYEGAPVLSSYPAESVQWFFEERIIREQLGSLIDSGDWPTERQVQLTLHRIRRDVYGGSDLPNVKGLRDTIMDFFNDRPAVPGLAVVRAIPQDDDRFPFATRRSTEDCFVREQVLIGKIVPDIVGYIRQSHDVDGMSHEAIADLIRNILSGKLSLEGFDLKKLLLPLAKEIYGKEDCSAIPLWDDFNEFLARRVLPRIHEKIDAPRTQGPAPVETSQQEITAAATSGDVTVITASEGQKPLLPILKPHVVEAPQTLIDAIRRTLEGIMAKLPTDALIDGLGKSLEVLRVEIEKTITDIQQESAYITSNQVKVLFACQHQTQGNGTASHDSTEDRNTIEDFSSHLTTFEQAVVKLEKIEKELEEMRTKITELSDALIGPDRYHRNAREVIGINAATLLRETLNIDLENAAHLNCLSIRLESVRSTHSGIVEQLEFPDEMTCIDDQMCREIREKIRIARGAMDERSPARKLASLSERLQHDLAEITTVCERNGPQSAIVPEIITKDRAALVQFLGILQEYSDILSSQRPIENAQDSFLNPTLRSELKEKIERTLAMMGDRINVLLSAWNIGAIDGALPKPIPTTSEEHVEMNETEKLSDLKIDEDDRALVESVLAITCLPKDANIAVNGYSVQTMKRCLGQAKVRLPKKHAFMTPDDSGFNALKKYATICPEAKQALSQWKQGRRGKELAERKVSVDQDLIVKSPDLFVLFYNHLGSFAFTVTHRGKKYADEHGIKFSDSQVQAMKEKLGK